MANGNTLVTRIGQINNAGDDRALFFKMFAGEILTAYHNATVTDGRFLVKNITSGKSASFPMTGVAAAKYHVPGENILDAGNGYLSQIKGGEKVINIDDLLISSTFIALIDEAMASYETRSIYSAELGVALALQKDGNMLRKVIQAARNATPYYTGGPVGSVLAKGATVATTASVLAAAIADAAVVLDNKNIPEADRFCYLKPTQYMLLSQSKDLVSTDFNGGNGNSSENKVHKCAGITLVKSNQVPTTNEGTVQVAGDKNGYFADYSNTVAVVATRAAAGTVNLLSLAVEGEYQVTHQGTLVVAKFSCGSDFLRSECAVEITKA